MPETRQVIITSCVPKKKKKDGTVIQGTNSKGPWMMYEVMATSGDGSPIQEDIISFAPLNLGEQTVNVEVRTNDYGTQYTFSPLAGAPSARPSTPADEGHEMLRQTIALLADRVSALETAVKGLGGFGSTLAQTDVPVAVERPVAAPAADEEIPF